VKQGSDLELVNAKLLVLSDIGGIVGASLWVCVYLIMAKVTARSDAGGLRRDAFGLHPQQ
jgi:hypothetical protein